MIILVEAHHYRTDDLAGLINPHYYLPLTAGRCQLNYVGYCYESGQRDSVLILPKVFLNESGMLLGHYTPEDLLTLNDPQSPIRQQLAQETLPNGQTKLDFLFRFSVWLYRAIRQFRSRHEKSLLPEAASLLDITDVGHAGLSELELIMALIRFHRENNSLLTHIKRFNTAQRHTVSWSRTVSRQQPLLQNGRPVYVNPVVKQKHINYDEELIVLYLSTLRDLKQQFGFRLDLNPLYPLLPERDMIRFRNRATRRLKDIRGKYFADKLLQVWKLLYQYYERQERLRASRTFRELLLVQDFNVVFEDMIDYLLSDPKETLPTALKDQPDGKRVDHIYQYHDLILPEIDQIYHIGDSKYYKIENEIGSESVFKQFTYARNVIQQNIDLLNQSELPRPLHYRDDLTEGYNPTPNFFISAFVNELDFANAGLKLRSTNKTVVNRHFEGRLFDRDTLILQAYNINFLFVLNAYVAGSSSERFRSGSRKTFREQLIDYLQANYTFWKLTPQKETIDTFVRHLFWEFRGCMYRPSNFTDAILLALPKGRNLPAEFEKENEAVKADPWTLC